jgi:hypothetical protein
MKNEQEKPVDQMSLFVPGTAMPSPEQRGTEKPKPQPPAGPKPSAKKFRAAAPSVRPPRGSAAKKSVRAPATPPPRTSPGGAPAGDVRLTVNIREDLHLKLKIAAAKRRTTIGELLEGLVEQHLR